MEFAIFSQQIASNTLQSWAAHNALIQLSKLSTKYAPKLRLTALEEPITIQ
jgi:hypothetical protein